MLISGTILTLYDHLLMFDDEVRRQAQPLRLRTLTRSSQRFGTCGEVARRAVRPVIRAERIEEADGQITRQFSTSISWCVPQDRLFRRVPDETCHAVHRTESFSPCSGFGGFISQVGVIPRSVQEEYTPIPQRTVLSFLLTESAHRLGGRSNWPLHGPNLTVLC